MDEETDNWMNEYTIEWMDGWMMLMIVGGWINGYEWMLDAWMIEWVD